MDPSIRPSSEPENIRRVGLKGGSKGSASGKGHASIDTYVQLALVVANDAAIVTVVPLTIVADRRGV